MSKALSKVQLAQVIGAITKYYPESYADGSWDNTGLLVDCSVTRAGSNERPRVLLAVDLTRSVAREAIDQGCQLVLAYHPFIFPSWKRVSASHPQQASAIELIQHGISVYCPHTAVDAAKGGVNDFLVGSLGAQVARSVALEPLKGHNPEDNLGYGRLVKLAEPVPLAALVTNIKRSLLLEHVQVAAQDPEMTVQSVAVCAGSGGSVFKSLDEPVDLYFTGELGHHDALRYREQGNAVILTNHSNSERAYIATVLRRNLEAEGLDCIVSQSDVDPLFVM